MSLNYVTVTGTFEDGSGNPLPSTGQTAYCLFTPSTQVYASGIPLITPAQPIQAPIIGGALKGESGGALELLATDNSGLTYGGLTGFFFWTVQMVINGQAQPSWDFFLPHSPATVDLSALVNTAAGSPAGVLLVANNLSDVASASAARTNLGLGSAATQPSSAFDAAGAATAAQANAEAYALARAGQSMTGFLAPEVSALTDATTIAVNAALGNDYRVTLGGNRTMGAPSNPVDGQKITFEIIQPASGGPYTITWTSGAGGYAFGAQSAPTLSTGASATDQLSFRYSQPKNEWLYLGSMLGF